MQLAGEQAGPWPRITHRLRRILSLSLFACIIAVAMTMWLAAEHDAALSRLSLSQAEVSGPLLSDLHWLTAAVTSGATAPGRPDKVTLRLALMRAELPSLTEAGAARQQARLLDRADLLASQAGDPATKQALLSVLHQLGQPLAGIAVPAPELRQLRRLETVLFYVALCLISYGGALVFTMLRHNDLLLGAHGQLRQLATTLHEAGDELAAANQLVRSANTALRQQNQRFEAALDGMSHALCMADPQGRLIVCNRPFLNLFGIEALADAPGLSVATMLETAGRSSRLGAATVALLAREQTALAEAGEPRTLLHESEGSALSIEFRPMADGGWVATYEDITDRRRSEARLAFMAHHDGLTGLPNRVQFQQHLRACLREPLAEDLAVLIIDIDFFKDVNDLLGHTAGDEVLAMVAGRLRSAVREHDLVARLGGDEFAVLQRGTAQPDAAGGLAERLVAALAEPYDVDGRRTIATASVGVVIAQRRSSAEQLLTHAGAALNQAKLAGRAGFVVFAPEMDLALQERRLLAADLRQALKSEQFELYYQPIYDLGSAEISSIEALLRWHHPTRGMISPAVFIPLAEEIGLITQIGEWVLHMACQHASRWPAAIKVAVNLSPIQFKLADLPEQVEIALREAALAPQRLELEITESVLLQDDQRTFEVLRRLHGLGVGIALDDFGTGYSSLSYLRRFSFDKIKIDRSFVAGIRDEPESRTIVESVIGLARTLGVRTTGEGIEGESQLAYLRTAGCTEGQGYLLARPLPLADLLAELSSTATSQLGSAAGGRPLPASRSDGANTWPSLRDEAHHQALSKAAHA